MKSRSPAGRVRMLYLATKFRPVLLTDMGVGHGGRGRGGQVPPEFGVGGH